MVQYFSRLLLMAILLAVSAVWPACAPLAPGMVQVLPSGESVPAGTVVNASAFIEIIPSGATTFAETHTLSLSTGLSDARWNVIVMVDGRQAAVIPKEGPLVYVNGFLLSYPTTRDVSVRIVVDGRVPPDASGEAVVVLDCAELNSQGQVVGGSDFQVTRRVDTLSAFPGATTATQAPFPATSPASTPFPVIAPVASLCLAFAFAWDQRR
ncbi:MAG TPA: hypothetical protein PLE70_06635 [Methanolinea sp.]|nr:hypothetical protein [Methanolinea sp.]